MIQPVILQIDNILCTPANMPIKRRQRAKDATLPITEEREMVLEYILSAEQIVKIFKHHNDVIMQLRDDLRSAHDEIRVLNARLNPKPFVMQTGNKYGGGYGD